MVELESGIVAPGKSDGVEVEVVELGEVVVVVEVAVDEVVEGAAVVLGVPPIGGTSVLSASALTAPASSTATEPSTTRSARRRDPSCKCIGDAFAAPPATSSNETSYCAHSRPRRRAMRSSVDG